MNNKKLMAGLMGVLAVACASQRPDLGPWGYEFALGDYTDGRKAGGDARLMSEFDFSTRDFMEAWRGMAARDLFSHRRALLDINLTHFEATRSQWSYAMTAGMDLRARDGETGRVLAQREARCNVVTSTNAAGLMGDSVQQAWEKGDLGALTKEGRGQTMWHKVWEACVRQIAEQFDQAMLAGR